MPPGFPVGFSSRPAAQAGSVASRDRALTAWWSRMLRLDRCSPRFALGAVRPPGRSLYARIAAAVRARSRHSPTGRTRRPWERSAAAGANWAVRNLATARPRELRWQFRRAAIRRSKRDSQLAHHVVAVRAPSPRLGCRAGLDPAPPSSLAPPKPAPRAGRCRPVSPPAGGQPRRLSRRLAVVPKWWRALSRPASTEPFLSTDGRLPAQPA